MNPHAKGTKRIFLRALEMGTHSGRITATAEDRVSSVKSLKDNRRITLCHCAIRYLFFTGQRLTVGMELARKVQGSKILFVLRFSIEGHNM